MNTPLIEACVDSYASCKAAWLGGADRLELCAHLVIGGTTPSTDAFAPKYAPPTPPSSMSTETPTMSAAIPTM